MASWYSMRFAIVDDLDTERTLLKERLARQLRQRGTEAELLEFDSGEAFLAAEKERRFTAAFLDIYMEGLSGMDAARELRKTDTDCLLVFTTTSTDHALEGFQVRAFHYLVKPFSETELSGLLDEMLSKLPRPEPILTVKVDGSDIRLRYRDIISAEHFAHMINIRTTAGKTLATRQSFKAFTEPLKKDPRFFVCGRGAIINMENAADFQAAAFCTVYASTERLRIQDRFPLADFFRCQPLQRLTIFLIYFNRCFHTSHFFRCSAQHRRTGDLQSDISSQFFLKCKKTFITLPRQLVIYRRSLWTWKHQCGCRRRYAVTDLATLQYDHISSLFRQVVGDA